jgi:hypothetical protein
MKHCVRAVNLVLYVCAAVSLARSAVVLTGICYESSYFLVANTPLICL